MKRKIMVLLLAALMVGALTAPAFADIMWEPYGNGFYESRREEMEYENRGYLTNGEKGYVTVREAPDSLVEVVNLPNGTYFNVGQIWTDKGGSQWAVGYHMVHTEDGFKDYTGWVPLSELALIYDYTAFEEDHGSEFAEYDGSGDHLAEVFLYSYPGGVCSHSLIESPEYMTFAESFNHLYTDENGRRWTFVGYYMGRQNGWVCIDDPMNMELGTGGYRTVGQVRSGGDLIPAVGDPLPGQAPVLVPSAEEVPPARTWLVWAIPAVLIVLLAAGTAVLVRKKKKNA